MLEFQIEIIFEEHSRATQRKKYEELEINDVQSN